MPVHEVCPGRLPPEKQTMPVPASARAMMPHWRLVMGSWNRKRENMATQTGAV